MRLSSPPQVFDTHLYEKNGERLNIETLVTKYRAYIFRLCLSILGDEDEADDLTQETFVAALLNLNKFRGDSSVRTWLSAISINLCRDFLRKRKSRQTLHNALQNLHLLNGKSTAPEDTYLQTETNHQLWKAVNKLTEKHRLPVILRYAHGLPISEIAQMLDLSEGTVHSRLHYARKILHGDLQRLPHLAKEPTGGLP